MTVAGGRQNKEERRVKKSEVKKKKKEKKKKSKEKQTRKQSVSQSPKLHKLFEAKVRK